MYLGERTVAIGNTIVYSAQAWPSHATNRSVTWKVYPTSIATIDATDATIGVLTGVSTGKATVTATANDDSGVTSSGRVTVTAASNGSENGNNGNNGTNPVSCSSIQYNYNNTKKNLADVERLYEETTSSVLASSYAKYDQQL